MTIGERLREARKQAGMKQSELAEKLGVAVITIGQYERDKRQPRLDQLEALAKALGVSTAFLTGEIKTIHIPMPEYPLPLDTPTPEQIGKMTRPEQEYYLLRLLADTAPDELKKRYLDNYNALNKLGQVEAVIRTKELTRLCEYTDHDSRAETSPQAPPPPSECPSITPAPDASETPPEGE